MELENIVANTVYLKARESKEICTVFITIILGLASLLAKVFLFI